jgi:hypothetical protein
MNERRNSSRGQGAVPVARSTGDMSRRAAIAAVAKVCAAALAAPAFVPALAAARSAPDIPHPEPRPGITAAGVLADEDVPRKYRDAYAAAREVPQVLDGIFCHCDCAAHRGMRSLLSCFESKMPQSCGICLGEARLALKLHREGKDLAAIRAAVDRRFNGNRSGSRDDHDHDH